MAANCGCPNEIWLTAGFRSSGQRSVEYYLFMKKECALYRHEANVDNEYLLAQPTPIGDFFPSLKGTVFANEGIDCAFAADNEGKAIIFSGNQCAEFYYAPFYGCDRIVRGPMSIIAMFPCLKHTRFECGIDAAFESDNRAEAYLFKGDMCARISHASATPCIISCCQIRDMFPTLRGTIFEYGGLDAAFGYNPNNGTQIGVLFKGDTTCHVHFYQGSTAGQSKFGPVKINTFRKNLSKVLPRRNNYNLVAN